MTVAQLIEFLKTQDQDAEVLIVEHTDGKGYYDQGGNADEVPFNPEKHVERSDLRDNPFAKGTAVENTNTLLLGLLNG